MKTKTPNVSGRSAWLRDNITKYFSFSAIIILLVALSLTQDNFLGTSNLKNLLRDTAPLMIMSAGMTMVLLFGSIDLSMGAVCSVSNVTYIHLMLAFQDSFSNPFLTSLAAMAVSLAFGLASGLALGIGMLVDNSIVVVENTYRDINIAYANELLKICRSDGMDVHEIIRIANKHPRVNILSPGPGVGGHCISVDPWFLVGDYPELAHLIRQARLINDSMPDFVLERTEQIMEENGITDFDRVGFYGLTYKENVDDVRESPTLQLIESMKRHLAPSPKCYDPMVKKQITPRQYQDFQTFVQDIDLMVVMICHDHLKECCGDVTGKVILDTRNCGKIWPAGNTVYSL